MEKLNTNNVNLLKDLLPDATKLIEADCQTKSVIPCTPHAPSADSERIQQSNLQVDYPQLEVMVRERQDKLFPHDTASISCYDLLGINDRDAEKKLIGKPLMSEAMTENELIDWLSVLNDDLRDYNLVQIPDRQVDAYIHGLMKYNFTFNQAEAAHWYIVYGKKTNYTAKGAVLPEYFFPTSADMAQFGDKFIIDDVMNARLDEQKRRFELERASLRGEIKVLESMCAELRSVASRATGKALGVAKISAEEKESLSLAKQIVAATDAKNVAVAEVKRLTQRLAWSEKEIKRLEKELARKGRNIPPPAPNSDHST